MNFSDGFNQGMYDGDIDINITNTNQNVNDNTNMNYNNGGGQMGTNDGWFYNGWSYFSSCRNS